MVNQSCDMACGEAATTYWGITSLEGSGASLKGSDLFSGIRRALAASRTVDRRRATPSFLGRWLEMGDMLLERHMTTED
jgi:hypothetical protein